MIKTNFYILIILALFACKPQTEAERTESAKPNIIYIMADDLGYADVGVYGQEIIQTPNIDRMAQEGMRFTQHYAGSPVCAPSRCVLMTGKHPGQAYVRGNMQSDPYGQIPLPADEVTVAEMMKQAGYITGMIGKWGLGVENTSGAPNTQGFDFFYGYLDQVLAHNYFPEYLWRNETKEYLQNEVKYLDSTAWHEGLGSYSTKKVDYSHDFFTKEALNFIEAHQDTSFFLYIPYTIPHNNGEALPGETQEVPDLGIYENEDWEKTSKGYAAMISRMDRDIGQLLDKLADLGIDENTLVIFTSDNGPMQEDRHVYTKRFDSNGDLRGGKRDLYEGGVRVPFIARWPQKIAAGTTSEHISAFWDFMPTACEITGVDPPKNTTGISYLPELLGNEQPEHSYLYWEFPENGYQIGIRMGEWKAVKMNLEENPNAPWQLYNLTSDLGESDNVADQHQDIIRQMDEILKNAHTPSSVFPMPGEEINQSAL